MPGNEGGRPLKVPRVLKKYNIEAFGDKMGEMWARDTDRYSVRELEVKLNAKSIASACQRAGEAIDEVTAEDYYRKIATEESEGYIQEQTIKKLDKIGVDIDELRNDFVSYHSVYTYLQKRNVEPGGQPDANNPEELVETTQKRVQEYREEQSERVDEQLKQLTHTDQFPDESPETHVAIKVTCPHCGRILPIQRYLQQQGCGCEDD